MSVPSTWVITGTSRGIGLELVRQLSLNAENTVFATCRDPDSAHELKNLSNLAEGRVHVVQLDVANAASIEAAATTVATALAGKGVDYLLNNAAINIGDDRAFDIKVDDLLKTFESNVIGPLLVAQAFFPLLAKGSRKVIMNTTSGLASFGLNIGPKCASYSISKTALNMLAYKQATEQPDFIVIVLDPGWVKTKMGGEGAYLELHESVTPILKFVTGLTSEHSGKFFNNKGEPLPW